MYKIKHLTKEKKKKLFNKRKIEYEKDYEDGERYVLCYSFEDNEEQIERSSKLLLYTYNLYKFTKK